MAEVTGMTPDRISQEITTEIDKLKILRGVGSPEGRTSAPVGSIYTDSEATNGALRWIKVYGSGNTGWRVEYGDTGLRDVTSLLVNGWTAERVLVRRYGTTVILSSLGLSSENSTAPLLISLPTTFHNTATYITMVTPYDSRVAYWNKSSGLTMVYHENLHVSNYAYANSTWEIFPNTPWPSSLPGTPA